MIRDLITPSFCQMAKYDNQIKNDNEEKWWCELEYFDNFCEYLKYGSKVYRELGKRSLNSNLNCYVKNHSESRFEFVGHMNVDSTLFSKIPANKLQRLLPGDFQHHFVPTESFAGVKSHIVMQDDEIGKKHTAETDDLESDRPRVYMNDDTKVEIKQFTIESGIQSLIYKYYTIWKPFIVIDKSSLPSPLSLATRYADRKPPQKCYHLHDWRGFSLDTPSKNMIVVSESIGKGKNGARQFVVFSPKGLSNRIASSLERGHPETFCEIFRADYRVTCIPFDLDVIGHTATLCWNSNRDKNNEWIYKCVEELRVRLNDHLREFLSSDFDIRNWPVGIFRRQTASPDKLSIHVYQQLPVNVCIEGIEHLKVLVNRLINKIQKSRLASPGTFLGHWECLDNGTKYQTRMTDNHVTLRNQNDEKLCCFDPSRMKFVSYIDTQIYKVNGSLRLPGCSKTNITTDVLVKVSDGAVFEDNIVDSLVHFPHRCEPFGNKTVRIRCLHKSFYREGTNLHQDEMSADEVQQIRQFIQLEFDTSVTKWKRCKSGYFFDTLQSHCPFAGKIHRKAKQYYLYVSNSSTLIRKCWHSHCQGRSQVITTACSTTS